jgi:FACT complex subunit SPT16
VDVDAILVVAGESAGEDEPVRKTTALQVCQLTRSTCHCVSHGADMVAGIRVSVHLDFIHQTKDLFFVFCFQRHVCFIDFSTVDCGLIPVSAKLLAQIEQSNPHVPVQIFAQAKPKDPPTDALPSFVKVYTSHRKVGMIVKEKHSGKVVDEWNSLVKEQDSKIEVVDIANAVSAFMATKDEEELVSNVNPQSCNTSAQEKSSRNGCAQLRI